MKKVYIVGKNFSNQIGGPANIIRGLISGLRKKNIEVNELCLNENFGKFSLIKGLLRILFFEKNCVVNVHTDGLFLPYIVYLFSIFDKKNTYFLTVHGLYCIESKMNGTYKKKYEKIEKKLCKKFPNIICVSQLLKETIIAKFKRDKQIYIIPNGIDISASEEGVNSKFISKPVRIIMLGGIRVRKGIFECLDVLASLNKNGIEAVLDIYGDIENYNTYKKFEDKILALGLKDNVKYKGILKEKNQVYKALKESDIQLCLSKWDTFNVAIIEALVIGIPCIVTDMCGAASAITENVNGIVINLNEDNYIFKIIDYLNKVSENKNNESEAIIKNSLVISKEYSWDQIITSYLAVINSCCFIKG